MAYIQEHYIKIPTDLVAIVEQGHAFVDPDRIEDLQKFLKSAKPTNVSKISKKIFEERNW